MASPQTEDGHIDIANTIADKLCSYRLSGQEWQVIWVVLRKTWGWLQDPKNKKGHKKKMDRIALSQFAELTGIDRRKCHAILKKLIDKRIIKKSVTQKGDVSVITYGFQKNFDLWKVSPKKVTVTQKGNKPVTQKGTHKRYIKERKDNADSDESALNPPVKFYKAKSGKKLNGKRLETFNQFWDAFNFKHGKATAADSWLKIIPLTNRILKQIIHAAKVESEKRSEIEAKGRTPKWAQGWLSDRRWEDEVYQGGEEKTESDILKEHGL